MDGNRPAEDLPSGIEPGAPPPALQSWLDRATRVLAAVAAGTLRLGIAALVAGVAIWWAVYRAGDPGEDRTFLLVVVGLLVLAPPAILFLFVMALRAAIALPRRLRETPAAVGERLGEIRRRMAEVGQARSRGFFQGIRSLFRLGWSVASSREVVELSPALVFLTPGMLVATLVAAGAAVIEILAGAIAILVILLS